MPARPVLVALLTLTAGVAPLTAQRFWLGPAPASAVGVTLAGAHFESERLSSSSGTVALRGRTPVGAGIILTGELPFARASFSEGGSGSAIGNPWIGIESASPGTVRWEVGVRPGIFSTDEESSDLAWVAGLLINFDSWEAWFPEVSSIRGAIAFGAIPDRGVFASGRVGATTSIPRNGDSEVFADYGARAGMASPGWIGWLGVMGHGVVTESGGSIGDRTSHQVELGVERRSGGVRPRATVRRYVGEDISDIYFTLGFSAPL